MVDARGEHRVQGLEPGTEVRAGNTEEQIGADIREAAGARRLDGLDRVRTGVEPLEKTQRLEHSVGVEVAVLADPGAEGHVQVEAVNAFHQSRLSTAMKASCGISTLPTRLRRFLPSFCFSSSLRLRVTSPP